MKFETEKKRLDQVQPGDVLVSDQYGARFVTEVTRNIAGQMVIYFSLPGESRDRRFFVDDHFRADRYWTGAEVTVLKVESLLRSELAARDAALDAVIARCNDQNASMCDSPGESRMRNDFLNLLVKHGVHAR